MDQGKPASLLPKISSLFRKGNQVLGISADLAGRRAAVPGCDSRPRVLPRYTNIATDGNRTSPREPVVPRVSDVIALAADRDVGYVNHSDRMRLPRDIRARPLPLSRGRQPPASRGFTCYLSVDRLPARRERIRPAAGIPLGGPSTVSCAAHETECEGGQIPWE